MSYKTIGIVGGGVIGKALFEYLAARDDITVKYVLVSDTTRRLHDGAIAQVITGDVEAALNSQVDLVLEAATPEFVINYGPRIVETSSLCVFSGTALADRRTEQAIRSATHRGDRRLYLPHGAILGLDGLVDGREVIESVTITTTKSGKSLGRADDLDGVVFDGSTRAACEMFPRNVNVHAVIALAGIGFDRTRSVVVARPGQTAMAHRIQVTGETFNWDMSVAAQSLGGVTGSYTPRSAVGSVARMCRAVTNPATGAPA